LANEKLKITVHFLLQKIHRVSYADTIVVGDVGSSDDTNVGNGSGVVSDEVTILSISVSAGKFSD
jgi:hypothetical protein